MKKVGILKVIGGDARDVQHVIKTMEKFKKENPALNDYDFIVTNDKLDFYTPKRFIKEMMSIVNELKKLEEKNDKNV